VFQSDLQTDMAFGQNLPESAPVCQYHIAAHLSIAKGPAFGLEPWTAELSGATEIPLSCRTSRSQYVWHGNRGA
jgi:hypothetical protein